MDVEIKLDLNFKIPKLVIYTNEITNEISEITKKLSTNNSKLLLGFDDKQIFIIKPNDVFSIFTENKKILARSSRGLFKLKNRLYEIEENPPNESFVRISNSEIVNFSKVSSLDTSITGTITLKFMNGEKTFVSRRYVEKIKKFLGV